jgi:NADPH:quinone reductase-like Zn-dependent oxidoreductase
LYDEVFGACRGAFAEYACAAESAFCKKPSNITFEQAAAVPVAAFTALQGLRNKARIKPGNKVLINGAAGGVGTMAIQVAVCLGAEVTAVCSAANLDLVRSLGAAHAIDYAREDFASRPERYDMIFDLVANHSIRACLNTLTPSGVYVGAGVLAQKTTAAMFAGMIKSLLYAPITGGRVKLLIARGNQDDLAFIAKLMEAGKVVPVIAKCYPLSAVADAIRHLETKHARGKIVLSLHFS